MEREAVSENEAKRAEYEDKLWGKGENHREFPELSTDF